MSRHKYFVLGAIICALIFFGGAASAQTNADVMFTAKTHPAVKNWSAIDNYASNLSFSTSTSYATAAAKICATARSDEEKARAIFAWIAHNIAYDVNLDESFCYSADGTWKKRKGACQGYSLLYQELAKTVGLNCEYVSGYNKKNGYTYKAALGNHGWIVVHLSNGKNLLMDPTWGAGNTDMVKKTFEFDYKDAWFDVDPYYMIMSHYPSNSKFQYLSPIVNQDKFDTLPRVEPYLEKCGISGRELYEFYLTHNKAWYPQVNGMIRETAEAGVKFNKIPMAGTLKKGESYTFNLTIPSGKQMMVKSEGSWKNLSSNVDFIAKATSTDDIILGMGGENGRIHYVLVYKVAASPSMPWANDAATINSRILAGSNGSSGTSGSNSGNATTPNNGTNNNGTNNNGNNSTGNTSQRPGPTVPSVTYGDAKIKGLNKTNIGVYNYKLTNGTTVNNQAAGKPKVLVFYATYCQYCAKLTKALAADYTKFSDVDLYFINEYKDSDQKIRNYISTNNAGNLKFNLDSTTESSDSYKEYMKQTGKGSGIPFVVFIDCNNKIQYVLEGCPRTNEAGTVRNIIDNYLIPKTGLPNTTQGNTNQGNTNQGNTSQGSNTGTNTGNTSGTTTPAPSNTSTPSTPAQTSGGLNIPNSISSTFTLLDGTKVATKANGKPKVLIFFKTDCSRCQGTTKSLGQNYSKFSDIDIYEIEINKAKKTVVQSFKANYGSSAMKFAYDEGNGANSVMWQYIRLIQGNVNTIGLPVIVYIDSHNVIQKFETATTVKYDHIREVVDGYLSPAPNSNECEDGVCEVPSPATPAAGKDCDDGKCEVPGVSNQPEKTPEKTPEKIPEKKPDPKPVLPETPKQPEKPVAPEKDGANKKNPVSATFSLVDGTKVTTTANGKPKILVFFATSCGRTKNFLKNINKDYGKFSNVDIIFVETRKARDNAVKTFQNKYAAPAMKFAYDTTGSAKKAMDTYVKTFLPKVKTANTPIIVFIDADNMVQEVYHSKALSSKQFQEIINSLLLNK